MECPLVTIIVLAYNQEKTISRTIDSILGQKTEFDFEILVGDDASIDGTRSIVENYCNRYPGKMRLMKKTPNKGLYRNSLECIRACDTEFVAFCAGDDYYCNPYKLQYQVEHLRKYPKCVAVHSEMKHVNSQTGVITVPPLRSDILSGDVSTAIFFEHIVYTPTLMFRRKSLSDDVINKLLSKSFGVDDVVFLSYIAQQGDIHHIQKYDVAYNTGGETACQSSYLGRKIDFINNVYEALIYVYNDIMPAFPRKILFKLHKYDICKAILSERKLAAIFKYYKYISLYALFVTLLDTIGHNNRNRKKYYLKYMS